MERTVCVVTDSTSDIPRDVAAELGISIVPLNVSIDGETFSDGDMSLSEFFRRMNAAKELPKTSQPSVGAFVTAFEQALEHCAEVVCVTISNRLSGTLESATEAARVVGERVHVFDSLNLSWGEGYQAVAAARAAAAGATVDEVKDMLEELRDRVHMVVGLDTLENLARGGRIGRVSALVGGMLNLKVLLTVGPDGAFEPVHRARGAKAALQATVDWVAGQVDATRAAAFAVQHAESPDKAAWLEAAIRERFNVAEMRVIEAGSVISTHTGTGWGVTAVQTG
ncbi:MAG: DegV family protein [Coriobacteriia bacterium]|nr:DegV family protein [Actinomycetota bacterium]MDZ4168006.1 DegV family protein [Coriobacteriia bacterium]